MLTCGFSLITSTPTFFPRLSPVCVYNCTHIRSTCTLHTHNLIPPFKISEAFRRRPLKALQDKKNLWLCFSPGREGRARFCVLIWSVLRFRKLWGLLLHVPSDICLRFVVLAFRLMPGRGSLSETMIQEESFFPGSFGRFREDPKSQRETRRGRSLQ